MSFLNWAFLHVYACTRASSLLYGQTVRVNATANAGVAISISVAEEKEAKQDE